MAAVEVTPGDTGPSGGLAKAAQMPPLDGRVASALDIVHKAKVTARTWLTWGTMMVPL